MKMGLLFTPKNCSTKAISHYTEFGLTKLVYINEHDILDMNVNDITNSTLLTEHSSIAVHKTLLTKITKLK